jgi:hypothetical protein
MVKSLPDADQDSRREDKWQIIYGGITRHCKCIGPLIDWNIADNYEISRHG